VVLLAVEHEEMLKGLYPRAYDINNVMSNAATKKGSNWIELAPQILQKTANEFCRERGGIQLKLEMALVRQLGKTFQINA